ncbi:MAG: PhoH family protein [Bacteroidetes bacterium]|nr:PhoH family protein [Bacteroidota bacterium]
MRIKGVNPVILLGPNDAHLRVIQKNFEAKLVVRGEQIAIRGSEREVQQIEEIFTELVFLCHRKNQVDAVDVETVIRMVKLGEEDPEETSADHPKNLNGVVLFTHRDFIEVKSEGQRQYVKMAKQNDIVFSVGPAGTGKTYLAVALAVSALKNKEVERIILSRPAVESGESLGFLPGDLRDKIDPYLRPLYDALHDMIPGNKLRTFMEQGIIEIVPLAYMRGRTLNNAFVILDEAQNTTPMQMKMFLTRLGANSKSIVTGDVSQSDLPRGMMSGLQEAEEILSGIEGIGFVYFSKADVVRHRLVRDIIDAYDSKGQDDAGSKLSIQRSGD